ncbi:MAG: hypothetical protein LBG09_00955 [Puniceicoccales bacterium]|jgi:MATE family multidrug resistance protein|nr:hypothetical protein [Puniceicoccales bacterium]
MDSPLAQPQYRSGGLREIWGISWPMILAAMSNYFMTLVDRIILSKYSAEAFIAASGAHSFYWANTRAMMAFMIMTGVFIGQFNGARNFRRIGQVTWQAILVAFAYYIVLIPCALNAKIFLADTIEDIGAPYLAIMLLFLPFNLAGIGAIGSFFLGIGHTRIVPIVVLLSNVINIILGIFLIFGWGNPSEMGVLGAMQSFGLPWRWLEPILRGLGAIGLGSYPAMGARGAAYAAGISQVIAFIIFLFNFLRKPYRHRYHTHILVLSFDVMKKCLPLGVPNAANSILNSGGFAIVHQIVAKVCSAEDLFAFTVANSIYLFFWFFVDGLGKGMCTICANYIGKNQMRPVFSAARSVVKILIIFAGVTAIFMLLMPQWILHLFSDGEVSGRLRWVFFGAWVALTAETFRGILQNLLISGGDVRFTVFSNISCFWLVAFLPIFLFVYILRWGGALMCWQFFALDSCMRIIADSLRFTSEAWWRKAVRIAQFSRDVPRNLPDQSPR